MKVTYNWLKQDVDFDSTPEELTEQLTMIGLEVEGVDKFEKSWSELLGTVQDELDKAAQGGSGADGGDAR